MQPESNCLRCGNSFTYSGRGRRSKFCSPTCWGIPKICAGCNVAFWAKAKRTIYHDKHCSGQASWLPDEARAAWTRISTLPTVEERFWQNVRKDGPLPTHQAELGPCWLWTGVIVKDYPKLTIRKSQVGAHRYSWELHNGQLIPAGLWVLHTCDRPLCVNPAHLYTGTPLDNARDRGERAWNCPNCGWRLERGERLRDI